MPASQLISLLEKHADALTTDALEHVIMHPRTPSFRAVPRAELSARIQALHRTLAGWLGKQDDDAVRAAFEDWGRQRFAQQVPVSELVYAVIVAKDQLRRYGREHGIEPSKLDGLVAAFFDRALYYLVRGYEMQAAVPPR